MGTLNIHESLPEWGASGQGGTGWSGQQGSQMRFTWEGLLGTPRVGPDRCVL